MLDIKFIKDNVDLVKENIKKRQVNADVDKLIEVYNKKNSLQMEIDGLRNVRNENSAKMKQKLSDDERTKLIEEGKDLKNKIAALEDEIKVYEDNFFIESMKINDRKSYNHCQGRKQKIAKKTRKNIRTLSIHTNMLR